MISMDLKLIRKEFTESSTIGELYVDGKFFCYTLEDKDRGLKQSMSKKEIEGTKVFGKTCIPYGTYNVVITYSPKFKRNMPLLDKVPGYSGIRIHSGNNERHSLGCLLVGYKKGKDVISESTKAFNDLYPILDSYSKKGQITITIEKAEN